MAKTSGGVRGRVTGNTGAGTSKVQDITTEYPDINLNVSNGNFPKGLNALKVIQLTGIMKNFKGNVYITPNVDKVTVSVQGNGLYMDRVIYTLNANDKYIYNSYFKISKDSEYSGKSLEIFTRQVKNASKAGFKRVEVSAAGDPNNQTYNGYYTWAAYGYKPNNSLNYLTDIFNKTGRRYGSWENMMKSKQGRADWKENGKGWSGSFDLTKGSESFKQLEAYTKDKKSKS